jgi:hypothetical protein
MERDLRACSITGDALAPIPDKQQDEQTTGDPR